MKIELNENGRELASRVGRGMFLILFPDSAGALGTENEAFKGGGI